MPPRHSFASQAAGKGCGRGKKKIEKMRRERGGNRMRGKILIVDDQKDMCDILVLMLADEGYQTFSALSGRSALNRIKKEKPDLVLLDIKMPRMDGIEALKRIKEIDKNIVVVMITGYGTPDTAREAMRLGAFDYVTKPLDINLIRAIISDALGEKKR